VRSLNIVGNGTISRSDTEVETLKAVGNAEENSKSDLANKGTEMNLVAVNKNETIPENQTGVEALSLKAEHWSIGETLHPAGESDPAGPSEQSILGEAGAVRSLEMLPNDHKKNTTNENNTKDNVEQDGQSISASTGAVRSLHLLPPDHGENAKITEAVETLRMDNDMSNGQFKPSDGNELSVLTDPGVIRSVDQHLNDHGGNKTMPDGLPITAQGKLEAINSIPVKESKKQTVETEDALGFENDRTVSAGNHKRAYGDGIHRTPH